MAKGRATLLGLLVSVIATVGVSWPLVLHLDTHLPVVEPGVAEPYPDQLFTAWILAHDTRMLPRAPLGVFESVNFHPFHDTLAYSENLIGVALPLVPLRLFTDNPVVFQNVALLFAMALGSFGVFLLVREIGGGTAAACLAAVFWTWTPNTWWNWSQLHVMASHPTPLAWWLLVRLLRTRSWRTAGALGLVVAWQVWATLHWGFFLALGLASGGGLMVVVSRRWRAVLPHLVAAAVIAGAACVPLVREYRAMARALDMEDRGSVAFLFPPNAVFPPFDQPLAYLAERATGTRRHVIATLAPWVAMFVGAVALVRRRRPPRRIDASVVIAIAVGGLANYWYSLGSTSYFGVPSLYEGLSALGGLGMVRGPIRAVQYLHFAVCVVAGVCAATFFARVGRRAGWLVGVALVALTVLETGWRPVPLAAAPPRSGVFAQEIASLPPGCALAELPGTVEHGVRALWHTTSHWRPVVNGYGGLFPMRPRHVYQLFRNFPGPEGREFMQAAGVCAVVLRTRDDVDVLMRAGRERVPAVRRDDETWIPVTPPPPELPEPAFLARTGLRVIEPGPEGASLLDGDSSTLVRRSLVPRSGREYIVIDLGAARSVSGVVLGLGAHWRFHMPEYRVDASLDGVAWRTLVEAKVAVPPVASYRRDPRQVRQIIRFPVASARQLRIGPYQMRPESPWLGSAAEWGAAEIDVLGGG